MPTLDTFQSIFFSILNLAQQSRITQKVGMTVLAGYVLKNCTGYRVIRLFRMFKKVPLILMGHSNVRRSVISLFSLLRKYNDRYATPETLEFYFISQQKSQNGYKIVKEIFLEE